MYMQSAYELPVGVAEDGILGSSPRIFWDTVAPDGDAYPWNEAAIGSVYARSMANSVRLYVKTAANDADADWVPLAHGAQASSITDLTITTDLDGVDTGTDMTATQAGQIETDLANIATKLNAVLDALDAFGITA